MPFGLALPLSVAPFEVTLEAAFVVTVGAAVVVKERIEPKAVATEFCAMAQK